MCSYQHHEGQMRLRATTLSRRWVAGSGGVQVSSLQESIFFSFCFCLYPFLGLVELICSVILSLVNLFLTIAFHVIIQSLSINNYV